MTTKNTRRHYRIIYPSSERPEAVWNGHKMFIVDLSESGVALKISAGTPRSDNVKKHDITIYMLNGFSHKTDAEFIRVTDKMQYVFTFKDPVPYSEIMKEQRLLIDKYGTLLKSEHAQ
jgi:hypothetical protein